MNTENSWPFYACFLKTYVGIRGENNQLLNSKVAKNFSEECTLSRQDSLAMKGLHLKEEGIRMQVIGVKQ